MANSDRISSEYTTVYFWCVWGDIHTAGRSGPRPESGSGRPATFWTIEPDRVCLRGSEAISVIVQNVYNVAGRDRISSLNNNTWPCNYLEDFVWDWPYHPKFVTIVLSANPLTHIKPHQSPNTQKTRLHLWGKSASLEKIALWWKRG